MTPEINALIATHVMGWHRHDIDSDWNGPNETFFTSTPSEGFITVYEPEPGWDGEFAFHRDFVNDISDAFEALEHWRKQDPERYWNVSSPGPSVAGFGVDLFTELLVSGIGEDAALPRAICRALLAAKRIEVPK